MFVDRSTHVTKYANVQHLLQLLIFELPRPEMRLFDVLHRAPCVHGIIYKQSTIENCSLP
jgi:hypothetical protein